MKRLILAGGALILWPCMAASQEFCTEPAGNVPSCLVGTWSGSNNMVERFNQAFAGLPEDAMAAARPSSGQYLFLHVAENGRFVSSPMEAAMDATLLDAMGGAMWLEAELQSAGDIGQFTTGGGDAISFCIESPSIATVTTRGESEEGSFESPMALPAAGAVEMPMRYDCAENMFNMHVDLPPPIGTVTYQMTRIPVSGLPSDLSYMLSED